MYGACVVCACVCMVRAWCVNVSQICSTEQNKSWIEKYRPKVQASYYLFISDLFAVSFYSVFIYVVIVI